MKQQFITFTVVHQTIQRTDSFDVVGGSRNYLYAKFTCCEDWADEQITAVFTPGGRVGGKPYTQPVVDGQCLVPWEVLLCRKFHVGLMAGARITSNAAVVDVIPSGVGDGDPSQPPTPTAYELLLDKTAELDNRLDKLEDGGTGGGSGSVSLPPGGKTGQVLTKASNADGDVVWADPKIPPEYGLITYYQDRKISVT